MNRGSSWVADMAVGFRFLSDMLSLLKRSSVVGLEHRCAVFESSWFAVRPNPWAVVEALEPVCGVPEAQNHMFSTSHWLDSTLSAANRRHFPQSQAVLTATQAERTAIVAARMGRSSQAEYLSVISFVMILSPLVCYTYK
jgi:hypothetical protein